MSSATKKTGCRRSSLELEDDFLQHMMSVFTALHGMHTQRSKLCPSVRPSVCPSVRPPVCQTRAL